MGEILLLFFFPILPKGKLKLEKQFTKWQNKAFHTKASALNLWAAPSRPMGIPTCDTIHANPKSLSLQQSNRLPMHPKETE